MKIPFSYILRNLWTRRLTTALTAGGMALVVFVFAAVLMLDAGLRKTLVATGSADNVILLRQGCRPRSRVVSAANRQRWSRPIRQWRATNAASRWCRRRSWC